MATTVTSKGQVTIPKPVREFLGIEPGSAVDFHLSDDGRVVLTKVVAEPRRGRFERLKGSASRRLSTDDIMALTRGEGA